MCKHMKIKGLFLTKKHTLGDLEEHLQGKIGRLLGFWRLDSHCRQGHPRRRVQP